MRLANKIALADSLSMPEMILPQTMASSPAHITVLPFSYVLCRLMALIAARSVSENVLQRAALRTSQWEHSSKAIRWF
jgi:hypothetical protein